MTQLAAATAQRTPDGQQVMEVTVDRGYHPQSIVARAGIPLRLVFHRRDDDPCLERVAFSSPRMDRVLRADGPTIVVLPARPAGEVRFTCAMGRYRGVITYRATPGPPRLAWLRAELTRLDGPLGTAAALWVCSLPLIALLAVLALDPAAALAAAALALLAWVVACLWAFGELRRRGSEKR